MSLLVLALLSCARSPSTDTGASPTEPTDSAWLGSVQARLDAVSYAFTTKEGRWTAVNAGQGYTMTFDRGARVVSGEREVELTLRAWGDAAAPVPVGEAAWERGACVASGAVDPAGACIRRLEARHAGVVEWYENGPQGLEQGFSVPTDPGAASLAFDIGVEGATVTVDGDEALFVFPTGAPLRYSGLRAWDADGVDLPVTMRATADGVRLDVDVRGARFPVEVDPTIVDRWYAGSSGDYSTIGTALAVGDINGDGFDDLFVGAYGASAVYGYAGGPFGPSIDATWTFGVSGTSQFGRAIAFLGDVNGDGYGDLAIGAPNSTSSMGKALVFHGAAAGPPTTAASWTLTGTETSQMLGSALAAAGDVNGDGYADLLVGSYAYDGGRTDQGLAQVHLGSATGLAATAAWSATSGQSNAYYGYAVAGVGDVDDDGYDDIVVGATRYDDGATDEGAAWLYRGAAGGPASTASWSWQGNQASAGAGTAVAAAGDVNDDGYADVFVGAPRYDNGHTDEGVVWLFSGSAAGLSTAATQAVEPNEAGAQLGNAIVGSVDFDANGYPDLVSGTWNGEPGSRALVYYTTAAGISPTEGSDVYGSLLGAGGDVDADGYDDLLVGYAAYGNAYVYLYPGGASGIETSPRVADWKFADFTSQLGASLSDGGDFDDDGYGDMLVGTTYPPLAVSGSATGYTATGDDYLGYSSATVLGALGDVDGDGYPDCFVGGSSAATVWYGSVDGLVDNLSLSTTASAVAAGDFDADGRADFAVGTSASSRVDVWRSTSTGITATGYTRLSGTSGYYFGAGLAVGDFDGDGYDDLLTGAARQRVTLSEEGRAAIYPGSATGVATAATVTYAGGQASARCSGVAAGDVNGDGYDDVLYACPAYTGAATNTGRVQLFYGGSGGASTTEAWSYAGTDSGDKAGQAIAVADYSGDGYADVALHVPGDDTGGTDTGVVLLFLGSADGLATAPDFTFVGHYTGWGVNNTLAAVTPIDGDGTPDLAWGVPLTTSYGGSGVWVYDLDDDDGDGESRFVDCDDDDADIHAGAIERTNGRDDDCNGVVDDVIPVWYLDGDGDGYGDRDSGIASLVEIDGRTLVGGDCDDTTTDIGPAIPEACNDVDDDCDDEVDEIGAVDGTAWYLDADGDGEGGATSVLACAALDGYAATDGDCDDTDAEVRPGAAETCNGIDDDCDGAADDAAEDAPTWYADADTDGYGGAVAAVACTAPSGAIATAGDCDDTSATVRPGGTEVCNGADDDCDGTVDDGVSDDWWADVDGDGYGDPAALTAACTPPTGHVTNDDDCDDTRAGVSPDGAESCNDLDDDCDGGTDEGLTTTFYGDADGDGHGIPGVTTAACTVPSGHAESDDDCDDADATVFPGAAEVCDDADQDCDGAVDEDLAIGTWYADADEDGYGDAAVPVDDCGPSEGYVGDATDCDDDSSATNPDAAEIWYDGRDQDCDGGSDFDQDGDGQDAASAGPDCDDTNAAAYDGAPEIWYDGVDQDCAGGDDYDRDGDGHRAEAHGGDDCDDTDDTVFDCGAPDGDDDDDAVGCGCNGGAGAPSMALGAALALLAVRRRRSAG